MTGGYVYFEHEGARRLERLFMTDSDIVGLDIAKDASANYKTAKAPNVLCVFAVEEGRVVWHECHNGWGWNVKELAEVCPGIRDGEENFGRWLEKHRALAKRSTEDWLKGDEFGDD